MLKELLRTGVLPSRVKEGDVRALLLGVLYPQLFSHMTTEYRRLAWSYLPYAGKGAERRREQRRRLRRAVRVASSFAKVPDLCEGWPEGWESLNICTDSEAYAASRGIPMQGGEIAAMFHIMRITGMPAPSTEQVPDWLRGSMLGFEGLRRKPMSPTKNIRRSLNHLGLADPTVRAWIRRGPWESSHPNSRFELGEYRLSTLAGVGRDMARRREEELRQTEGADFRFAFDIHFEGECTGVISSDGVIELEGDLVAAYKYAVASDWGRKAKVSPLDLEVKTLLDGVQGGPKDAKDIAGHDRWMSLVRAVYRYEVHSRFADGWCAIAPALWKAATGEKYPVSYAF